MNVAISAQAGDINALVDPRFGRAGWFVLADTGDGEWTAVENSVDWQISAGVGAQAAGAVLALGVGAVITGNVGPTAKKVLSAGGAHVYLVGNGVRVREAIDALAHGELAEAVGPTVAGHWA